MIYINDVAVVKLDPMVEELPLPLVLPDEV